MYHGCLPLYHFDFYRLSLASEVQGIGFEDYSEASGVMIIEWAEKFPELLPNARLDVYIDIIDTDKRVIQWSTSADVYSRYFL